MLGARGLPVFTQEAAGRVSTVVARRMGTEPVEPYSISEKWPKKFVKVFYLGYSVFKINLKKCFVSLLSCVGQYLL